MRDELWQALEDCQRALRRGEDLEGCLQRYPHLAKELRPLLETLLQLRALGGHLPPPEARARAWRRFSQQVARLQSGRRRQPWRWLSPLAMAASLAVVIVSGLALTALAASRSLPDSPLYRAKLAMAEAQVFITWDDDAKAALLLDQAEARQREVQKLLDQGKEVPGIALSAIRSSLSRASSILAKTGGEEAQRALEVSQRLGDLILRVGPRLRSDAYDDYVATLITIHNARLRLMGQGVFVRLEEVAGGLLFLEGVGRRTENPRLWRVGQQEVWVDEATIVAGEGLAEGKVVRVLAGVGANGRLRALTVTSLALPGVEVVLQGVVEDVQGDQLVVEGQRIRLFQADMAQGIQVGDLVQVRAYMNQGGLVAAELRPLTPLDMAATIIIEGAADEDLSSSQGAVTWRVGGHVFRVLPTTMVMAEGGALRKGVRVRVIARQQGEVLVAERILVLESQAPLPRVVAVQGVLQGVEGRSWNVGGVQVQPPPQAPRPEPGSILRIQAVEEGGTVRATDVVVIAGPESTGMAHVRGVVSRMEEGRWTVDGTVILVTKETKVSGKPAPGSLVEVWGELQANGSVKATFVEVLGGEPGPSPTPTPEATPQATPTPTSTPEATPQPTSSSTPTSSSGREASPVPAGATPTR